MVFACTSENVEIFQMSVNSLKNSNYTVVTTVGEFERGIGSDFMKCISVAGLNN